MKTFTLASLLRSGGVTPAVCVDDKYYRFSEDLLSRYPTLKAAFEDWPTALQTCSEYVDSLARNEAAARATIVEGASLDTPIRFPNKLIAAGANYKRHLAEMGLPVVRFDPMPIYFMPPTTCMVGPGRTVQKPKTTEQFDWEIELTAVIGSRIKDASVEEAAAAIAGYTIGLDMSARDLIQIGPPFYIDLVRGKAQDTMAPVGPVILPAEFLPDARGLDMKLYVNDKLMMDSNTSDMIFDIPEILSGISKYITLEPGDMVMTGSPEGSGVHHNYFLKPGDKVRGVVQKIGTLDVEIY